MAVDLVRDEVIEEFFRGAPVDNDTEQIRLFDRLISVASALVEKYAPLAPQDVQNEAAIRVIGYLKDTPKSAVLSIDGGGRGFSSGTTYPSGVRSALRHSGAMAILSPWKIRRAGVI